MDINMVSRSGAARNKTTNIGGGAATITSKEKAERGR
jgi:hypothetical protein